MATAGTLVINLIARTSVFDRRMRSSRGRMKNFSRQTALASAAIRTFGLVIGAAGAGLGVMALTKNMAAFSKQMAMVSTMLDDQSMRLMPQYRKQIRQMSVEFGEGTATLSKGLYDILSASVAPTKALNVLAVSAKAAKGGFTTTAVAADAVTTVLKAYDLEAERAIDVSDKLFAIVKRGKITFEELGSNIGKTASLANVAGLSFDQLGAAISTMTRAGLPAEIAITSVRAILNAFLSPADDAATMAKKFGFAMNTATLRAEGLTGVLQKLKKATAEELAVLFPNIRALAGFATAISQVEGNALDLKLSLEAAGRTQEAFAKAAATSDTAVSRLWESTKNLGISLTDLIETPVTKFFDLLAGSANIASKAFSKLGDEIKRSNKVLGLTVKGKDIRSSIGRVLADPSALAVGIERGFSFRNITGPTKKNITPGGKSNEILATVRAAEDVGASAIDSVKELEKVKEVIKSIRSQDFLTRTERILALREYATLNAETLAEVATAQKALNAEILSLERARVNQLKVYFKELRADMQNTELFIAEKMATAARSVENSMGRAFTGMIMDGMSFRDAMVSFAHDIQRAFVQMLAEIAAKQIMGMAIGAIFGGAGGALVGSPAGAMNPAMASIAHSGGIVGRTSFPQRAVSPGLFSGAPRLHNGLGADEFPAILQRGEQVIPRGGGGGGLNVVVEIKNESGQKLEASQGDTHFDGESYIIQVITKNINEFGSLRGTIQNLQ